MGLGSFWTHSERKSIPLGHSKESLASDTVGKVGRGSWDFIWRAMESHGRVSRWVEGEYIKNGILTMNKAHLKWTDSKYL